jgi:hypothetical protein
MNVRFSSQQHHAAHAQAFPTFFPPYAAPRGSPTYFPPVAAPQQGEFGYSAPRNYRSTQIYPNPIQNFLPCCPWLAQTYPQGFAPHSALLPAIDSRAGENTSNFVSKNSYWSSSPFVFYKGIRQQVARRFVDFRQARRKSQRVAFNSRRFRMSFSTALLPKDRKKQTDDHVSLRIRSSSAHH